MITSPAGLRSPVTLTARLPERMRGVVLRADLAPRFPPRPGAMGRYRNVRVSVEEQFVPRLGRGEALLEVQWVGVCGSDIHCVQTDAEGYASSSVPAAGWERSHGLRLGHEYAAVVRAVGPGTSPDWLGRAVTGDSLLPCRRCEVCRAGQWNYCPEAVLIGLERDGVFGEYAVVPASSLHALESVSAEAGTLAEPLGVAANALISGSECLPRGYPLSLLIFGGGPLGLLAGLAARPLGFAPVAVVEPNPARRALASRLGLSAFAPGERRRERFGAEATVVLDACGLIEPSELITAARPGGVIVSVARTGSASLWPDDLMMTRGIRRVAARGHVGFVPRVLGWLARGRIDLGPLITRRLLGLDELGDWLRDPARFAAEGKVICRVRPSGR